MSGPARHQRTRALPSTAEQPAATTEVAPPVRFWRQKVPAHIGRARTSTLVLAMLFVAFFSLYLLVRPPAVEYTTVETTSGQTVRVPVSELEAPPSPEPTEPAAPTSEVTDPDTPTGTPPATTAPGTTPTPRSTSPQRGDDGETTQRTPSSTRAPATTRAPDTEEAPATSAEPDAPTEEETASPTG
jgi:hypothetical protein